MEPHSARPPEETARPVARPVRWWVVIALLAVVGLGAWLASAWPSRTEATRAVNPESLGRDSTPTGTAGGVAIPGGTGGPPAPVKKNGGEAGNYPRHPSWSSQDVLAYLDRQPLYATGSKAERLRDSDMMVEASTDRTPEGNGYLLYVPRDSASTPDVTARQYFLRLGPDQYFRVDRHRSVR